MERTGPGVPARCAEELGSVVGRGEAHLVTRSVRLGNGSSAQNGRLHLLPRGNPSCPQLLPVPGATMFQRPQIIKIWGILSARFVLETPTHGVGAARRIKVTPAGLWETQQPGGADGAG